MACFYGVKEENNKYNSWLSITEGLPERGALSNDSSLEQKCFK